MLCSAYVALVNKSYSVDAGRRKLWGDGTSGFAVSVWSFRCRRRGVGGRGRADQLGRRVPPVLGKTSAGRGFDARRRPCGVEEERGSIAICSFGEEGIDRWIERVILVQPFCLDHRAILSITSSAKARRDFSSFPFRSFF